MSHDASPTAAARHRGRLTIVLGVTMAILVAEVIGGIVSHSLVLLADAGHMAADTIAIGLSLLAMWFATRAPSDARTFGFQRAEILAAVANAIVLFAVSVLILIEAARRLDRPLTATPSLMIGFGIVALIGNAVSITLLHHGAGESLNIRGAFLEVLSDLLGALAVLVAAIVIATTHFERADPIASVVIGALILPRTVKLLKDAIDVLLEATPKNVDPIEVRDHISSIPGVIGVHDLHIWTVTSGVPVLSVHVVVEQQVLAEGGGEGVLDHLSACLAGHFDVEHCTFQLEPVTHRRHEGALHP